MKKRVSLFLIIGIVILSASAAIFFYFYQKNQESEQASRTELPLYPEAPADWQTYTSEDFGISLKIPPEVNIDAKEVALLSKSTTPGLEISPPYQEPFSDWWVFSMTVIENPQNTDAQTLIESYSAQIKNNCTPPACNLPQKIEETTSRYKNEVLLGYAFKIGNEPESLIVVHNNVGKTYVFSIRSQEGLVADKKKEIFEQILNSIKFIN